ncbi:G-type lectin S-receptor-like serine/threonine-protein kinase At4g27290 [Ricinus communis]|uniref:G-type lectin S-receptor-like serine/threonine-protein kinase At4g27290 n=1 Tax=Ricinus communis TaxID=3988 RepID=UPI00201A84E1|nr:G-type lectin S-receptor-like serine/threonine-protein kinase At4g27290 [Ricinus communis]
MLLFSFFFFMLRVSAAQLETLYPGQSMKDGETLISADGNFELGFFSQGDSRSRYLGIWYKRIPVKTVVWVGNREVPSFDNLGVLQVNQQGVIILQNSTKGIIWSSNSSRTAKNPVLQLLDSGNLIVKDGNGNNPDNIVWQSFDFPYNTLLPSMKLGWNLDKGLNRYLTSWKSIDDPAQGNFSCLIDLRGFPQLFMKKGDAVQVRSGPWNGLQFTGSPQLNPNTVFNFSFVSNKHEIYYSYELKNTSVVSRLIVSEKGALERHNWIDRTQSWTLFFSVPTDQCDTYLLCGAYASCNINSYPVCSCLEGFVPKSPTDWSASDWSDGCVRRTELSCHTGDGFRKLKGMKLPDTSSSWVDMSMDLKECEGMCLRNCSCLAYANSDIRGSGCLLWFDHLIDMRKFTEGGQDLYIRIAASELAKGKSHGKRVAIIVSCLIIGMGMTALGSLLYTRKRKRNILGQGLAKETYIENYGDNGAKEDTELIAFDLITIRNATSNFSNYNKLGEGGFGPVYKGTLLDGQEIAVKRLSETSGQGGKEFKNEVILIARLQHRNLVKLLGCCIHGDEKMLIYEYMPNKSLDSFIFDKKRSTLLDWHMCFRIIGGIARGLLYLHQDSRLRIIHRDLKASNILLDCDMNPKISDFGLARTFGKDQNAANTKRVVGTYGYMSPEYAVDGLFSVKSDVFSFGVLVLEIVSGKRNRGFSHLDHSLNLLGHAWRLWMEERALELFDKFSQDEYSVSQVLRCIQVGLLCVQRLPHDRPDMSAVVVMLGSESSLPQPKQPGFYTERDPFEADSSTSKERVWSRNEISSTLIEPR